MDTSNKTILDLLQAGTNPLILVEESDGSNQCYMVNDIEKNELSKEPLYRVTPAKLDTFDFNTTFFRKAKFIKKTDTGRDDDLITV